ncbi:unnamed protein product [Phytophthora lilii]|uniref:Unnamed protein product n=1 Tax=Phytophthora lilii TaxID=2077276 RepID=A0A9W7CNN4_9STRA|nr:unnamed protein product [Phytophthora lilii]
MLQVAGVAGMDAASMAAMAASIGAHEQPHEEDFHGGGEFTIPDCPIPVETELSSSPTSSDDHYGDEANHRPGDSTAVQGNVKTPQSASRRALQNAMAAKRRMRYLQKVKSERVTLTMQERELSTQLSKLRQVRTEASTEKVDDTLSLRAWRAVAIRQKERRWEAEEQQRRLRQAVITRCELINQMKDLLVQRLLNGPAGCLDALEPGRQRCSPALCKMFIRELDSLHAQTNAVIEDSVDLQLSSSPLTIELMRRWNPTRRLFESADATIIPFDFERACDAMSKLLLANSGENSKCDEIGDPVNTVASTCCFNYSEEFGESGVLVMHAAGRRYVEPNRVVFVLRALTEGQGEFAGLQTHETVWYVLRPSSPGKRSEMVLETYTQLMPVGFDIISETDVRGNAFTEILAKADEDDVSELTQGLRELLIRNDGKMSTEPRCS